MNSTHIISQDVFDKIRSRFTNLEMGDEQGIVTSNPKEARFFDFDFVIEGKNLGRVSISINEIGALKVFYSQGILEDTDDFVHHLWYDFLREMRMFAKRRLLRFDTRDITKSNLDKDDFKYLANKDAPEEEEMTMNESTKFHGTKLTSRRVLEKATLIAKHHTPIEDEGYGARSRKGNIKALYIENEDGERFKYPFIHVAGAKAMQRHVANGGRPYDDIGNAICKMSENIAQLEGFQRLVNHHDGMNRHSNEISERAHQKLQLLRRQVESICGQGGYESWTEGYDPQSTMQGTVDMDEATMETYKARFTETNFREDLAQYFPLLHSIMQEAGEIDLDEYVNESNKDDYCDACDRPKDDCECDDLEESYRSPEQQFEEWASMVEERKLEPDTLMALKDLLDGGLTLDAGGTSAIEALQGIGIHDDELEDALSQLANVNDKADPKDTILAWLAKDDPEAAQEFGYQGTDATQGTEEPTDAPAEDDAEEDSLDGDDKGTERQVPVNLKEIAELVFSMYNRNHKEQGLGPFPKGAPGVVTHVEKELGESAKVWAEQLVRQICRDSGAEYEESAVEEAYAPAQDTNFTRMKKLAGVKTDEADVLTPAKDEWNGISPADMKGQVQYHQRGDQLNNMYGDFQKTIPAKQADVNKGDANVSDYALSVKPLPLTRQQQLNKNIGDFTTSIPAKQADVNKGDADVSDYSLSRGVTPPKLPSVTPPGNPKLPGVKEEFNRIRQLAGLAK